MNSTNSKTLSVRSFCKLLTTATACTAVFSVSAADDPGGGVMPPEGKLLCSTLYRHNVPLASGKKEFVMVTSGQCKVEDGPPELTHEYVMSLEFNEKGIGHLISGNGFNLFKSIANSAHTMTKATYTLEFTNSTVSGWTATGELLWNAGHYAGKTTQWDAYATGPETLVIQYKVDL